MKVGKFVADFLYVHLCVFDSLPLPQQTQISQALAGIPKEEDWYPNVVKMNTRTGAISLLLYPGFFEEPFPELRASWTFGKGSLETFLFRRYDNVLNPPILHRKELLVASDHPLREEWENLTRTAESLGLFEDTRTIGFKVNWERLIQSKGYVFQSGAFYPVGNDVVSALNFSGEDYTDIFRHLTALERTNLSGPVQLLIKHGLLSSSSTFFDYGCGRGNDVGNLSSRGINAAGWDPYFAPEMPLVAADVVNLGFVINVIDDSAERIEAIHSAYALARKVLAVSVMLQSQDVGGQPYRDGVVTLRRTFQKYFTQTEFQDYLEQALSMPVYMVAPGVAFIFPDVEAEQRFVANRYRTKALVERVTRARIPSRPTRTPRPTMPVRTKHRAEVDQRAIAERCYIDALWRLSLELGRFPDRAEIDAEEELATFGVSASRGLRLLQKQQLDLSLLRQAGLARRDDLLMYFVNLRLSHRRPYQRLDPRLKLDIKSFFGTVAAAEEAADRILSQAAEVEVLHSACIQAAENGTGWLNENHSLQLHADLVDRLPAVLRAYIACGIVLWNFSSEVQLLKLHIASGKLSLLEYEGFDTEPLPRLRRRIKINLRRLACDVFDYGTVEFPQAPLYWKSRYLHSDYPNYAEQLEFEESLIATGVASPETSEPNFEQLTEEISKLRLQIDGFTLAPSTTIPPLDQACGKCFTYRSFVECGETQERTKLRNIPKQAQTYNALFALATNLLDPIVEYFGAIRLSYGFCSFELSKEISGRIAPKLDQHAGHELSTKGNRICARDGAACDFFVEDEDMTEVAAWVAENLPFDRLYIYGADRPLHISYGPDHSREIFSMKTTESGRLIPVRIRSVFVKKTE